MTIEIEEKQTKHVPGITSLFITFPYDKNLIEIIKSFGTAVYDKKNHTWELPSIYLSAFLDKACHIGDINLKLLRDKPDTNKIYTLSDYKIKPLDHQIEAIQYGLNHDKFLLLDAPGLGKTASIIHIAEELYKQHKIEHCLVICGLNTLKMNWVKEIKKHSDLSYRVLGQKISKKGKFSIGSVAERLAQLSENISEFFVITNIETLRDKKIASAINKNKPNVFDMIVLDEAHVCKNPSSQQGNNLLKLKKAKHQIAATGTVLLNDPIDCLVPLRWIGAENSCKSVFEHFYYQYGGDYGNQVIGFKNLDILKDQLSKYSIRRDKSLLNLPPKTIIPEYVEMDDTQAKFYFDISNKIVEEADKVEISTVSLLAMVTRLRQATAAPSILTTSQINSAKIQRAVDLARQIVSGNEKVVIFSTFKEPIQILSEELEDLNPLIVTGDTKCDPITISEQFQTDPSRKVFLGTWQKAGTGIDLYAASYLIFIDTPWTEGVFTQCSDRIYRIGTSKNVFIYNLITKDTIDERVWDIVQTKGAISDYVVDDKLTESGYKILQNYIQDLKSS